MEIYDFTVKTRDGRDISLSDYKGKVLLIVNTATGCGFTPHYKELQALYTQYHKEGFEILDFPCNQFGEQAPGTDEEIHSFCTKRYGITFPQFSKVEVNGQGAIPLYKWLVENTAFVGFDTGTPMGAMLSQLVKKQDRRYKNNSSIKWNFTKFLIDRNGNIIARFEPTASMAKVREKIREIIG